jgi:hypothetical protein
MSDTQIVRTCPQSIPKMRIVITIDMDATNGIQEEIFGHTAGMIYNALCDYGFDEKKVQVDIWRTG